MTTVQQRTASETDTGRACPYCRFPLKEGIAVSECGACHSTHHADCWGDNGGCAIVGCAGGPSKSAPAMAAQPAAPSAPAPAPPEAPTLPKVAASQPVAVTPAPVTTRKQPWLIVAVFVLALAVAGAAAAYYFTGKKDKSTHATPVAQPPTGSSGPVAGTGDPGTGQSSPPPVSHPAPAVSDRVRIERVLKRYYGDVHDGNFDAAWALLSPTYKQWKSSNGGRSAWEAQERRNQLKLDQSGLSVSITSNDRGSGVATIYVSGMHFGANRCDYVGYTWARKVAGTWYYDQGYVQNAARAAKWRPRQDETLGVACEPKNNPY